MPKLTGPAYRQQMRQIRVNCAEFRWANDSIDLSFWALGLLARQFGKGLLFFLNPKIQFSRHFCLFNSNQRIDDSISAIACVAENMSLVCDAKFGI